MRHSIICLMLPLPLMDTAPNTIYTCAGSVMQRPPRKRSVSRASAVIIHSCIMRVRLKLTRNTIHCITNICNVCTHFPIVIFAICVCVLFGHSSWNNSPCVFSAFLCAAERHSAESPRVINDNQFQSDADQWTISFPHPLSFRSSIILDGRYTLICGPKCST